MKKSLLALAALSAFAGAASAQVTLSGGVDAGVVSKLDNKTIATNAPRSNLTFSGKEDLGNGASAYFLLNLRFKPETGTTSPGGNGAGTASATSDQLFRNSYLGLTHGTLGSVQLGRFLSPLQENDASYDPFGTFTVGSVNVSTGNVTSTTNNKSNARLNSAIEYRSPVMGGAQLLVAAADTNNQGVAAASATTRPAGASLSFNQGPVSLALAYDRTANDLKTAGVFGKFTLPNKAALMFQYEKGDYSASEKITSWSLGAKVPVAMVDVKLGYLNTKTDITGTTAQKKLGLGLDYNLSKRTLVYTDIGKYSGGNAVATGDLSSVQKKTQWDIGIAHKF